MLKTEVIILDSLMGTGKSHYMLNHMVKNSEGKYMYITPYLNEVDRVMNHEGLNINRPLGTVTEEKERADILKCDLEQIKGTNVPKYKQINGMIEEGLNVVSTHETFKRLEGSSRFNEYTLILDEVVKLVDIYDIKMKTVEAFESEGYIIIDSETGKITPTDRGKEVWNKTEDNLTKFLKFAEKGLLYKVIEKVIITEYPIELITQFKQVYILTYIFEGSYLKYFLDMHGIGYKKCILNENKEMVDWNIGIHKNQIVPYRSLLNLHNPPCDRIKGNYNLLVKTEIGSLSSGACSRLSKPQCIKLNNIIKRYAVSMKATSDNFIYCVYKDVYNRANKSIKGYSNSFLPYNTKATNDYKYATSLAYCVARFINPVIKNYMEEKAKEKNNVIEFHGDKLALADMVQFIFRGCIRDKKPMNLFIADEKTRHIFLEWLFD